MFIFYYCLIFPVFLNRNEVISSQTPGPGVDPVGSTGPMLGFIGAEQICLSLCLFVLVFVSLIVCVYMHFCWWPSQVFLQLWQFSAWSPLMCLSVYLLSQHSWFIYIYKSRKWQQRIILTLKGGKYTLVVICCECEFFLCVCVRVCDLPMSQLHITHAMTFIRYEVKSASRNMTNAFGKITSVVWIQSLWQLTANDTGGNFSRQRWWAILLLAGATNWQIGTKSWLEEINAWRLKKKGAVGPNEPMNYFKLLPIHEGESERGNIRLHGNKLIWIYRIFHSNVNLYWPFSKLLRSIQLFFLSLVMVLKHTCMTHLNFDWLING